MYVYAPGTTTLRPVYASNALTTRLSNPVIADGAGKFPDAWLDNTLTYKLVFKDKSGATLDTFDPYTPGQAPDATALAPYQAASQSAARAAVVSATTAATWASGAANSATNASLSAAAALAAANPFPNTTAGLAATAEGGYFVVVGTGDTAAILYREVSGAAVEQTRWPSLQALQSVINPIFVNAYGASGGGDSTTNRNAFESALAAAAALGGGVVVVPPANASYNLSKKTWTDAASTKACIRVPARVELHIAAGATVKMADNQIADGDTHVIVLNGADAAVTGFGTIDGGSLNQTGWSTYEQDGPAGVLIREAAQCHRARIGAGAIGYLTIQNCFGNPINGGGSVADGIVTDISVCGLWSDNVGEGAQLEGCDRVEMRRIVTFNTLGNMTGDGAEMAACTNFLVEDIYSENIYGSGFDLFGCQMGRINRVTCVNCNFNIHDFTPVEPCADVDCDNIVVIFSTGGTGDSGVLIASTHATIAPTNIRVRGRIVNTADLNNGVNITQNQDVATYGGGPYDFEVDVEGATVAGFVADRAPRLNVRARIRNCAYGFQAETTGLLATDNVGWDLHLDIADSGTTDFRINGTAPTGRLSGSFDTASGPFYGLASPDRSGAIQTDATDGLSHYGASSVHSTATFLARIARGFPGQRLAIIFDNACEVANIYGSSVDNRGIRTGTGASLMANAGDAVMFVYNAVAGLWQVPRN